MLHHVSVGVADVTRAATFYDAVLKTLGYKRLAEYLPYAVAYGEDHPEFWIGLPHDRIEFLRLKQMGFSDARLGKLAGLDVDEVLTCRQR